MRRLFLLGLIAGFAATLAAAHYIPWVRHASMPVLTNAAVNGGRTEEFQIRLPADRIQASSAAAPAEGAPASGPARADGRPLLVEHYRLRDSVGNVIGIAARHVVAYPEGATTSWALFIPGRGTVVVASDVESQRAIDAALARRGFVAGRPWRGEITVDLPGSADATRSVMGTEEFADTDVQYAETWTITGVDEDGEVRGTIVLDTLSRSRG